MRTRAGQVANSGGIAVIGRDAEKTFRVTSGADCLPPVLLNPV